MRFLILNTDYSGFLNWLYGRHAGLERRSYEEQMRVRNESLFSVADFYSSNLRKLGHEAWEIHFNNEAMQAAWAREHGLKSSPWSWKLRFRKGLVPWLTRRQAPRWFYDVLAAQIRHYRPDVVLNQAMDGIRSDFMRVMKPLMRLLVGQIAAPLPTGEDFGCYNLVITAAPHFVDRFRKMGMHSELNRLAFEPRVLTELKKHPSAPVTSVSFVGSLTPDHAGRISLLKQVAERFGLDLWGAVANSIPEAAWFRRCFHGQLWGTDMYRALQSSKIALNRHIDVAEDYAGNMRLYEATGVGTLLLTDWKANLQEMFEPGREVAAYRSVEECIELIKHYLEHEEDRMTVAQAGQARTLRDHTYQNRMQQLVELVSRQL